MKLKESNLVPHENLKIGQTYYVTNLGLDSNYKVNLKHDSIYCGVICEYQAKVGKVFENEITFPLITIGNLSNINQSNTTPFNLSIQGWNIHSLKHSPKFYQM